jgi:hypothetical protein
MYLATKIAAALIGILSTTQAAAWQVFLLVPTTDHAQVVSIPPKSQQLIRVLGTAQSNPELRFVQPCGRGGEAKILDSSGRVVGVRICPP